MQLCTELFSSFKVEDKISVGNLELFPINASLLRQPENTKSLPELMEAGAAIITEMSERGDVELAHVRNLSEFYLFIADGEITCRCQTESHCAKICDYPTPFINRTASQLRRTVKMDFRHARKLW